MRNAPLWVCFSCSPTFPSTTRETHLFEHVSCICHPSLFLQTQKMCPYGCVFRVHPLSLPQHEKHARFSNFHPSPPPSFENQKRGHLWAHFRYLSFPVMRHDERTYLGTLFMSRHYSLPLNKPTPFLHLSTTLFFPFLPSLSSSFLSPLFSLFFFLVIFLYSLFRYYLFVW